MFIDIILVGIFFIFNIVMINNVFVVNVNFVIGILIGMIGVNLLCIVVF